MAIKVRGDINTHLSIISIMVAIAALVVGIVNPIILQKRNEKSHQPQFAVHYPIKKTSGSDVYDYQEKIIINLTHNNFVNFMVENYDFLQFVFTPDSRKVIIDTLYVPLKDYFVYMFQTGEVEGIVYSSLYSEQYQNWKYVGDLYHDAMDISKNPVFADANIKHLTKVSYDDVFGEHHELWFQEDHNITKSEYERMLKKSHIQFKDEDYRIDQLQISDLVKMFYQVNK